MIRVRPRPGSRRAGQAETGEELLQGEGRHAQSHRVARDLGRLDGEVRQRTGQDMVRKFVAYGGHQPFGQSLRGPAGEGDPWNVEQVDQVAERRGEVRSARPISVGSPAARPSATASTKSRCRRRRSAGCDGSISASVVRRPWTPRYASTQPCRPQRHCRPSNWSSVWPHSPALLVVPRISEPSTAMPAPTPVPRLTTAMVSTLRPTPNHISDRVTALSGLST